MSNEDIYAKIARLRTRRTMSHFATSSDYKTYGEGYREAISDMAELAHQEARIAAPSVASEAPELPPLPESLEIYWPELHSQALGCGVEDRNIHDRYEAAEYGWQDGVDRAVECVPE